MRGLKSEGVADENISGIGGDQMGDEGLESLWPMDELCVMGLWEVLWHLPRLLRLIHGVVEEIEERSPDVLVTIDLPDFNFNVAKRLKKRGKFKGKIIHYVAPTVWAWRPGRAKKVAAFLDGVMCLFPFEPDYFKKHDLKAIYVGHPLIEVDKTAFQREGFRANREIEDSSVCVGLFLGSRERELKKLSKPFLQTMDALKEQYPDLVMIVPTLPSLEYQVMELLGSNEVETHVVFKQSQKWNAIAACDVALAASGTVGLELAYAGIPHIIGYKTHPITTLLLKVLVKTPYAHLANILLEKEVVPEFLQGKCNVNYLTRGMMRLIGYPEEQAKQKAAFAELESQLRLDSDETPSKRAATFILS